ncbi:hypothetical protein [Paraburkholderia flava]|uniref:hypothetical protein n=1 Tax=Paraburkholderia flava TaxID=2547393 RepID=UPI00105DBBA3|nr:hypothetical protein [Paraburkholderia flava]
MRASTPADPVRRSAPGDDAPGIDVHDTAASRDAHETHDTSSLVALCALCGIGLLVGSVAVIGPTHVAIAVAETVAVVGIVLVAALVGIALGDRHRRD